MRGRVMSMLTVILFGFITIGAVVVALAGATALARAEALVAPVSRRPARAAA